MSKENEKRITHQSPALIGKLGKISPKLGQSSKINTKTHIFTFLVSCTVSTYFEESVVKEFGQRICLVLIESKYLNGKKGNIRPGVIGYPGVLEILWHLCRGISYDTWPNILDIAQNTLTHQLSRTN